VSAAPAPVFRRGPGGRGAAVTWRVASIGWLCRCLSPVPARRAAVTRRTGASRRPGRGGGRPGQLFARRAGWSPPRVSG